MTRGRELFSEKLHVQFSDILTGPFKNKPFLYVIGFYSLGIMSMALAASFFVYYLKYFMMYDEEGISIAMAIIFVPSIFWIPIVDYVSKRFSRGKGDSQRIQMGVIRLDDDGLQYSADRLRILSA